MDWQPFSFDAVRGRFVEFLAEDGTTFWGDTDTYDGREVVCAFNTSFARSTPTHWRPLPDDFDLNLEADLAWNDKGRWRHTSAPKTA